MLDVATSAALLESVVACLANGTAKRTTVFELIQTADKLVLERAWRAKLTDAMSRGMPVDGV